MLVWYVRYETRSSARQSILSSALFESDSYIEKREIISTESGKEMSEFHIRFRAFADPIFRGALILTGNTRNAEKLLVKIYMKSFMLYLQAEPEISFKEWLLEIVDECFSDFKCSKPETDVKSQVKRQKALHVIASSYEPAIN
jgi:hypothetical protein